MTFIEAYNQYLIYIEVKLKKQSKKTLEEKFENHILPYWKDYDIYNISTNDYINWQYKIEKENYKYNYKSNLHYSISGFLNYCCIFHNLNKNVAKEVGNFKKTKNDITKHNFYNIKEFKKFIKYIDNEIYRQFFILMFFTGTRPGEAMALKFSDLKNNSITINKTIDEHTNKETKKREIGTPKTLSSYRNITIDNTLKKDLLKLKELYKIKYDHKDYDYFIFGGIKPIAPTTINRYKKNACLKANIKPIKLHEFRHSHATLLFNNNINIYDISKRLGHSDIAMTLNTYTHSNNTKEKRVIKKLSFLRLFL